MIHRIEFADALYGDELREIVRDDEAGTVAGDHSCVERAVLEQPPPVDFGDFAQQLTLRNPRHGPADFLAARLRLDWRRFRPELLPESLRGADGSPALFARRGPVTGPARKNIAVKQGKTRSGTGCRRVRTRVPGRLTARFRTIAPDGATTLAVSRAEFTQEPSAGPSSEADAAGEMNGGPAKPARDRLRRTACAPTRHGA